MANDPSALFRDLLGQWAAANQFGQDFLKPGDASRAAARGQETARDAVGKALTAFNLPSRADVTELAEQVARVEERLSRIESLLIKLASESPAPAAPRRRPARAPRPAAAPLDPKT